MSMIKLWAAVMCVSLGLLAMPVAMADSSGKTMLSAEEQSRLKADLFAAFDRIIRSEQTRQRTKDKFERLAPNYQQKTLQFYNTGGNKQIDERKLVKGVFVFMGLLENIEVAQRGIDEYQRTKQMPSQDPLNFDPMLERLTSDYPWFEELVDVQTVKMIDALVSSVYIAMIAESEKRIAESEKRIAELKENIKLLQTLLNAL